VDRWLASALARWSLLILTYHGVRADDCQAPTTNLQGKHVARSSFAAQLDYLVESGYHFLNGSEFRTVIETRRLPTRPSVVITFDDGYENVYTQAFPVLRERGASAILFVVGRFIRDREPLWVDRLEQAVMQARCGEITVAGHYFALKTPVQRRTAEAILRAHWKRLNADERERQLYDLLEQLQVSDVSMPRLYEPLSWEQIFTLRSDGWEVGSHTMTHTVLSSLDRLTASNEIKDAKKTVEAAIGGCCDLFAYPNGLRGDFTPASKRLLAELGKVCAVASIEGRVTRYLDRFAIRRVSVSDSTGMTQFRLRITGAVGGLKWLKAHLRP
jgi:peptidoglycan/xylan/chitin deacetylase (PgdA/CDA1 family)